MSPALFQSSVEIITLVCAHFQLRPRDLAALALLAGINGARYLLTRH